MAKFKVGDPVRVVDEDEVGVVIGVNHDRDFLPGSPYTVEYDDGDAFFAEYELEPVEKEKYDSDDANATCHEIGVDG